MITREKIRCPKCGNLTCPGYYGGNCVVHPEPKLKDITESEKTVKDRIIDLLTKQTEKGVAKYGHTLDDCPDDKYDWRLMAMEELIDLVQYQQKEIIRLERLLNHGKNSDSET